MSDQTGGLQNPLPNPLGSQHLPPEIAVLDGTDVDALWKPFRFYEAGHFRHAIMNPLSPEGLDQIITTLEIRQGERVLDIACGHGDFLLGAGAQGAIGTGVDLSPWTIRRAYQRLTAAFGSEAPGQTPDLILGDGRRYLETVAVDSGETGRWDIIALIGAPWVWGGFEPAAAALAERLAPGGRLVIADVVAASVEISQQLPDDYGAPLTDQQQQDALTAAGLTNLIRIPTSAADWRRYDDDVLAGLRAWTEMFPDDSAFLERGMAEEAERADPANVGWQVWIAHRP